MAFAASRKIPRILTTRISWNSVPQAYKPNFFVDVTDGLDVKIEALKCYKSEFMRRGADWEKYIRSSAVIYGLESGYSLAEAFEVVRYGY
jgi:LmbE family N-acetylglucosaminyl deacetylase